MRQTAAVTFMLCSCLCVSQDSSPFITSSSSSSSCSQNSMYGLRGNVSNLQPPKSLQQGVTASPESQRASPVFLETQTYWLLWTGCVCVCVCVCVCWQWASCLFMSVGASVVDWISFSFHFGNFVSLPPTFSQKCCVFTFSTFMWRLLADLWICTSGVACWFFF